MNYLNIVLMRCQPFHRGHENLIEEALNIEEFLNDCGGNTKTIVIVGSANKSRTLQNPFTYVERFAMISSTYADADNNLPFTIYPLPDFDYDDAAWEEAFHQLIKNVAKAEFGEGQYFLPNIVSSSKDSDAGLRKAWGRGAHVMEVEPLVDGETISGTRIREILAIPEDTDWSVEDINLFDTAFPDYNFSILDDGINFLQSETANVSKYKASWEGSPFPVQFSATDALVRDCHGAVALIKRGGEFGTGALALVGGFLEANLTYEQNMKKEVLEEINLDLDKVPHVIVTSWLCDAPNRDSRGRMTTLAFLVQLEGSFEDLNLQAGDDAASIHYVHYTNLEGVTMWADHFGISRKLLHLEELGVPYVKAN